MVRRHGRGKIREGRCVRLRLGVGFLFLSWFGVFGGVLCGYYDVFGCTYIGVYS